MQFNTTLFDQLQLGLLAQAANTTAAPAPTERPAEHFLTVANNGTVLGATNTVTGVSPDSLLMTSM